MITVIVSTFSDSWSYYCLLHSVMTISITVYLYVPGMTIKPTLLLLLLLSFDINAHMTSLKRILNYPARHVQFSRGTCDVSGAVDRAEPCHALLIRLLTYWTLSKWSMSLTDTPCKGLVGSAATKWFWAPNPDQSEYGPNGALGIALTFPAFTLPLHEGPGSRQWSDNASTPKGRYFMYKQ